MACLTHEGDYRRHAGMSSFDVKPGQVSPVRVLRAAVLEPVMPSAENYNRYCSSRSPCVAMRAVFKNRCVHFGSSSNFAFRVRIFSVKTYLRALPNRAVKFR